MSVSTFDPDPAQVSVTNAAVAHITAQIARSGHRYLRLGVKESGCNGYMYTLDYIDQPDPMDQSFPVNDDICLYVQRSHLPLVQGTEVDYVIEGLNGSLKFHNPNAATHCGCGESFSLQPAN